MEILIIIGLLKVAVLGVMLAGALFIWRLLTEARDIERDAGRSEYQIWGRVDD